MPSPRQANTPNTPSDGEGSVIPNRPPRIATGVAAPPPTTISGLQMTPAEICMIMEVRIKRESLRMAELADKMTSMDQEFTEVDMNEISDLKLSIQGCRRQIEKAKEQRPVEAIPRPPVRLPRNDPPTPGDITPRISRQSRSRPRSERSVRGRSKADKRRRQPDSGDRRASTRRKGDPIVVTPAVTTPKPTVASIFQGGAEDLSSSCPTSQEPVQTVPQIFQAAGAALSSIQGDPPRDPRSQSEHRRRVSIQTPPIQDEVPEGQIPVPFSGRPLQPRSMSAEPQLPLGEYSHLESRQDPNQQGRSTYYG